MRHDRSYIGCKRAAAARFGGSLAVIAVAIWLGGCSTAIPLPSLLGDGDVTGSIDQSVSPLSSALDAEDLRHAKSALSVALDPQGNGAPVRWDNPESGVKGSIIAAGDAFPSDGKICRPFVAELGGTAPAQNLRGMGCRDKAGDWTIADVKPSNKA
jgi:surface antigen